MAHPNNPDFHLTINAPFSQNSIYSWINIFCSTPLKHTEGSIYEFSFVADEFYTRHDSDDEYLID